MLFTAFTNEGDSRRYDPDRHDRQSTEPDKSVVDRKRTSTKPPPPPDKTIINPSKSKPVTTSELLEEDDPPLAQLMGFSKFSSTKGKKHEDYGTFEMRKKQKYRQYMNRAGGFNRPLDAAEG